MARVKIEHNAIVGSYCIKCWMILHYPFTLTAFIIAKYF